MDIDLVRGSTHRKNKTRIFESCNLYDAVKSVTFVLHARLDSISRNVAWCSTKDDHFKRGYGKIHICEMLRRAVWCHGPSALPWPRKRCMFVYWDAKNQYRPCGKTVKSPRGVWNHRRGVVWGGGGLKVFLSWLEQIFFGNFVVLC